MKTKFIELGAADAKAKMHMLESLAVCAHDHTLSRKLLARYPTAAGPMFAIIGDWFDLSQMTAYDYTILPPAASPPLADGDRSRDRLVAFVLNYLQRTEDAIVVCENWAADRADISRWQWPPPRVTCYGDNEVYHIVTPDITDAELIEAAVIARHHWQTGVCSACDEVPRGDIANEGFLDEIAQKVRHVFIPAFDGSGYLIWSPEQSGQDELILA